MKLSTKGRYGVTLMLDLAMNVGEGPISLKSIAERHELSEHYLEQLITPLRNSSLVRSVRGAYGGYVLAKDAREITVGDVIRVLEGPIALVEEQDHLSHLWDKVNDAITLVLDSVTLAEIAEERKMAGDGFMYHI